MGVLATRAEIIKLGRELSVDPDDLEFLKTIDAHDLREFRAELARGLDAPHRPMFIRLGKLVHYIPDAIVAKVAVWFFSPMLTGLVASEVSPSKAADLMELLPVDYVADAASFVDPVRAVDMIRELPILTLIPIATEIRGRKDFVTLAKFISAVTDDQLRAVIPVIESGEDMLMTGFYAEATDRFELILQELSDGMVKRLIVAAADIGKIAEALTLIEHTSSETQARLCRLGVALGDGVLTKFVESAYREQAWVEVAQLFAVASDAELHTVMNLPIWNERLVEDAVRTSVAAGRGDNITVLVRALPEHLQEFVRGLDIADAIF